jgi:thiol-disulfide isomerase/thioredoxin
MNIIFRVSLIALCLSLLDCSSLENKSKRFSLQGTIIGQNSGKIILYYGFGLTFHSDTTKIENGRFSFKGTISEPTKAGIIGVDNKKIDLFLEPGNMTVSLNKDDFKANKVTGSKSQSQFTVINRILEASANKDSVLISFIRKNPKSYVSPYYLQNLGIMEEISPDSLAIMYSGLDPLIQMSRYGRFVKGLINQNHNVRPGSVATDFKVLDINNDSISLSTFREKNIVLLELWNSMCAPCRKNFPHLRSIYRKYHSKGLEVIAIDSFDKNRKAWELAVNLDSINMWHNVGTAFTDGKIINEVLVLDYPIYSLPTMILIDKKGRVINGWKGYSEENQNSLDQKLSELFD